MKVAFDTRCITPLKPCNQAGYVQRTHESEGVHDDLFATTEVLYLGNKTLVFTTTELIGIEKEFKQIVLDKVNAKGVCLKNEDYIIGGSHNHSAPSCSVLNSFGMPSDPDYIEYLTDTLAESIVDCLNKEAREAEAYYTSVIIDGIYSNRNDPDKLSDKTVHLIKFVDKDEVLGLFVSLSCHNTVMGPLNYQLTGELFGGLRRELGAYFNAPVLVAQGTAGDMGDRQYRTGQDFPDLENKINHLSAQIKRKIVGWEKLDLGFVNHRHDQYDRTVILDSSIYDAKIARYEELLKTETDLTARKVMLSGIAGFKRKQAMGDGERTFNMDFEVYNFNDLVLINVPGELGSVLGLMVKRACPKKCIIWGYTNDSHLGYMVEKEAYETECQETNVTVYPAGVCEEYMDYIIKTVNEMVK